MKKEKEKEKDNIYSLNQLNSQYRQPYNSFYKNSMRGLLSLVSLSRARESKPIKTSYNTDQYDYFSLNQTNKYSLYDEKNNVPIVFTNKEELDGLVQRLKIGPNEMDETFQKDKSQLYKGRFKNELSLNLIIEKYVAEFNKLQIDKLVELNYDLKLGDPHQGIRVMKRDNYRAYPLENYDFIGEGQTELKIIEKIKKGKHVKGLSKFFEKGKQSYEWRECIVKKYDQQEQKYCIKWTELIQLEQPQQYEQNQDWDKKVTRLNLIFEGESKERHQKRFEESHLIRHQNLYNFSENKYNNVNNLSEDTQIINRQSFDNILKYANVKSHNLESYDSEFLLNLLAQTIELYNQYDQKFINQLRFCRNDIHLWNLKYKKRNKLIDLNEFNFEIKNCKITVDKTYTEKNFVSNSIKESESVEISIVRQDDNEFFNASKRINYYVRDVKNLNCQRQILIGYGLPFQIKNKEKIVNQNYFELVEKQFNEVQFQPSRFFSLIIPMLQVNFVVMKQKSVIDDIIDLKNSKQIIELSHFTYEKQKRELNELDNILFRIETISYEIYKDLEEYFKMAPYEIEAIRDRIKQYLKTQLHTVFYDIQKYNYRNIIEFYENYFLVYPYDKSNYNHLKVLQMSTIQYVEQMMLDKNLIKQKYIDYSIFPVEPKKQQMINRRSKEQVNSNSSSHNIRTQKSQYFIDKEREKEKEKEPDSQQRLNTGNDKMTKSRTITNQTGTLYTDPNVYVQELIENLIQELHHKVKQNYFIKRKNQDYTKYTQNPFIKLVFNRINPKNKVQDIPNKKKKVNIQKDKKDLKKIAKNERIKKIKRRIIRNGFYIDQNIMVRFEDLKVKQETCESEFIRSRLDQKYEQFKSQMNFLSRINQEFLLDELYFQFDLKLEQIQDFILETIVSPYFGLTELYEQTSFVKKQQSDKKEISFENIIDVTEINRIIELYISPLVALQMHLNNFDYLVNQKEVVVQAVNQESKDERSFEPYLNELIQLNQDLDYVNQLPDFMVLMIYKVELAQFKRLCIDIIETNIHDISIEVRKQFESIVEESYELVKNIHQKINIKPNTIEEFLEMKNYLTGEQLQSQITLIQTKLKYMDELQSIMSQQLIEQSIDHQLTYIEGKCKWVYDLENQKSKAEEILKDSKQTFQKILDKQKEGIFSELEQIDTEIFKFQLYYDIENCNEFNRLCKQIIQKLEELQDNGDQMNLNEQLLNFDITNISKIKESLNNFQKYNELWDFISSKWRYRYSNWISSPFYNLDIFEMDETISLGLNTMESLKSKFESNQNILELIDNLLLDINRINGFYELIIQMKHQSFKERHLTQIVDEIYMNRINKPEITQMTLEQMIVDKIFDYKQVILRIAHIAKIEFNIMNMIDRLVIRLKFRIIRSIQVKVGFLQQINFIRDPSEIIYEMNQSIQIVKEIMKSMSFPPNFQEIIDNMYESMKVAKETMEKVRQIQFTINYINDIIKIKNIDLYLEKENYKMYNQFLDDYKKRVEYFRGKNLMEYVNMFNNNQQNLFDINFENQFKTTALFELNNTYLIHFSEIYENLLQLIKGVIMLFNQIRKNHPIFNLVNDLFLFYILKLLQYFPDQTIQKTLVIFHTPFQFMIEKSNQIIQKDDKEFELKKQLNSSQINSTKVDENQGLQGKQKVTWGAVKRMTMKNTNMTSKVSSLTVDMIKNKKIDIRIMGISTEFETIKFQKRVLFENCNSIQFIDNVGNYILSHPNYELMVQFQQLTRESLIQMQLGQLNKYSVRIAGHQITVKNMNQSKQQNQQQQETQYPLIQNLILMNELMFSLDLMILVHCELSFKYITAMILAAIKSGYQEMQELQEHRKLNRRMVIEQLMFQLFRFREILYQFSNQPEYHCNQFEFLALPKYTLQVKDNINHFQKLVELIQKKKEQEDCDIDQQFMNNQSLHFLDKILQINAQICRKNDESMNQSGFEDEVQLKIVTLNQQSDYLYNLQPINGNMFIQTQMNQQYQFSFIQALSLKSNIIINSNNSQYTVKQVCYVLGQNLIQIECNDGMDYKNVINLFLGVTQLGFMMMFNNFKKLTQNIFNNIIELSKYLRQAKMMRSSSFTYNETNFTNLNINCQIVLNQAFMNQEQCQEIGQNLVSNFRIIYFQKPNFYQLLIFYFEIYFKLDRNNQHLKIMCNQIIQFMILLNSQNLENMNMFYDDSNKHHNNVYDHDMLHERQVLNLIQESSKHMDSKHYKMMMKRYSMEGDIDQDHKNLIYFVQQVYDYMSINLSSHSQIKKVQQLMKVCFGSQIIDTILPDQMMTMIEEYSYKQHSYQVRKILRQNNIKHNQRIENILIGLYDQISNNIYMFRTDHPMYSKVSQTQNTKKMTLLVGEINSHKNDIMNLVAQLHCYINQINFSMHYIIANQFSFQEMFEQLSIEYFQDQITSNGLDSEDYVDNKVSIMQRLMTNILNMKNIITSDFHTLNSFFHRQDDESLTNIQKYKNKLLQIYEQEREVTKNNNYEDIKKLSQQRKQLQSQINKEERLVEQTRQANESFQKNDWILFDLHIDSKDQIQNENQKQTVKIFEQLVNSITDNKQMVGGFGNNDDFNEDQTIMNIPHFIIKTNTLKYISPGQMVDINLFLIKSNPYSLQEQFENWLLSYIKHIPDYKYYQKLIINLFEKIAKPLINKTFNLHQKLKSVNKELLIVDIDRKTLLQNLTNILGILLNEERKGQIAKGNIKIDQLLAQEKKLFYVKQRYQTFGENQQITDQYKYFNKNAQFNIYGSQTILDQNQIDFFTELSKQVVQKDPIDSELVIPEEILNGEIYINKTKFNNFQYEINEYPPIESIFVFSIQISIGQYFKQQYQGVFENILIEKCSYFCHPLRKSKFAFGIMDILLEESEDIQYKELNTRIQQSNRRAINSILNTANYDGLKQSMMNIQKSNTLKSQKVLLRQNAQDKDKESDILTDYEYDEDSQGSNVQSDEEFNEEQTKEYCQLNRKVIQEMRDEECIYNYFYNIQKCKWQQWKLSVQSENQYPIISNSLSLNVNPQEILKFNSKIGTINTLKRFFYNSYLEGQQVNSQNSLYIKNDNSHMICYLMDYCIAYRMGIQFVGQKNSGKTHLINEQVQKYGMKNDYVMLSMNLNRNTLIKNVINRVEDQLIMCNKNTFDGKKTTIIVDDVNLAENSDNLFSAFRSLQQYRGWFSYQQLKYLNLKNTNFLLIMNDKPNSHLLTKTQLLVQQPLSQNQIFSIFRITAIDIYKNYQQDPVHNFGYYLIRELSKEVIKYKNHLNQFMNAVDQLKYFSNNSYKTRQNVLTQFIYCLNNNVYDLTQNNNYLGLFQKYDEKVQDLNTNNDRQYGSDNMVICNDDNHRLVKNIKSYNTEILKVTAVQEEEEEDEDRKNQSVVVSSHNSKNKQSKQTLRKANSSENIGLKSDVDKKQQAIRSNQSQNVNANDLENIKEEKDNVESSNQSDNQSKNESNKQSNKESVDSVQKKMKIKKTVVFFDDNKQFPNDKMTESKNLSQKEENYEESDQESKKQDRSVEIGRNSELDTEKRYQRSSGQTRSSKQRSSLLEDIRNHSNNNRSFVTLDRISFKSNKDKMRSVFRNIIERIIYKFERVHYENEQIIGIEEQEKYWKLFDFRNSMVPFDFSIQEAQDSKNESQMYYEFNILETRSQCQAAIQFLNKNVIRFIQDSQNDMQSNKYSWEIYNKIFGLKILPRQISILFYDFLRLFFDIQQNNLQIIYSQEGGNKMYIENVIKICAFVIKVPVHVYDNQKVEYNSNGFNSNLIKFLMKIVNEIVEKDKKQLLIIPINLQDQQSELICNWTRSVLDVINQLISGFQHDLLFGYKYYQHLYNTLKGMDQYQGLNNHQLFELIKQKIKYLLKVVIIIRNYESNSIYSQMKYEFNQLFKKTKYSQVLEQIDNIQLYIDQIGQSMKNQISVNKSHTKIMKQKIQKRSITRISIHKNLLLQKSEVQQDIKFKLRIDLVQFIDLNVIINDPILLDLVGYIKKYETKIIMENDLINGYKYNIIQNGRHYEDEILLVNYFYDQIYKDKFAVKNINDNDFKICNQMNQNIQDRIQMIDQKLVKIQYQIDQRQIQMKECRENIKKIEAKIEELEQFEQNIIKQRAVYNGKLSVYKDLQIKESQVIEKLNQVYTESQMVFMESDFKIKFFKGGFERSDPFIIFSLIYLITIEDKFLQQNRQVLDFIVQKKNKLSGINNDGFQQGIRKVLFRIDKGFHQEMITQDVYFKKQENVEQFREKIQMINILKEMINFQNLQINKEQKQYFLFIDHLQQYGQFLISQELNLNNMHLYQQELKKLDEQESFKKKSVQELNEQMLIQPELLAQIEEALEKMKKKKEIQLELKKILQNLPEKMKQNIQKYNETFRAEFTNPKKLTLWFKLLTVTMCSISSYSWKVRENMLNNIKVQITDYKDFSGVNGLVGIDIFNEDEVLNTIDQFIDVEHNSNNSVYNQLLKSYIENNDHDYLFSKGLLSQTYLIFKTFTEYRYLYCCILDNYNNFSKLLIHQNQKTSKLVIYNFDVMLTDDRIKYLHSLMSNGGTLVLKNFNEEQLLAIAKELIDFRYQNILKKQFMKFYNCVQMFTSQQMENNNLWFPYIKNKALINEKYLNFSELKISYFEKEITLHDDFNLVVIYNNVKQFNKLSDWTKSRLQVINNNIETIGDQVTNNICYIEVFKEMVVKTINDKKLSYVYDKYQDYNNKVHQKIHNLYQQFISKIHFVVQTSDKFSTLQYQSEIKYIEQTLTDLSFNLQNLKFINNQNQVIENETDVLYYNSFFYYPEYIKLLNEFQNLSEKIVYMNYINNQVINNYTDQVFHNSLVSFLVYLQVSFQFVKDMGHNYPTTLNSDYDQQKLYFEASFEHTLYQLIINQLKSQDHYVFMFQYALQYHLKSMEIDEDNLMNFKQYYNIFLDDQKMVQYFSQEDLIDQVPSVNNHMEYFFGSHVIKPILPKINNKTNKYIDFQNDPKYCNLTFQKNRPSFLVTKTISRLSQKNNLLTQALMKISIQQLQAKIQKPTEKDNDIQSDNLTVTEENKSSQNSSNSSQNESKPKLSAEKDNQQMFQQLQEQKIINRSYSKMQMRRLSNIFENSLFMVSASNPQVNRLVLEKRLDSINIKNVQIPIRKNSEFFIQGHSEGGDELYENLKKQKEDLFHVKSYNVIIGEDNQYNFTKIGNEEYVDPVQQTCSSQTVTQKTNHDEIIENVLLISQEQFDKLITLGRQNNVFAEICISMKNNTHDWNRYLKEDILNIFYFDKVQKKVILNIPYQQRPLSTIQQLLLIKYTRPELIQSFISYFIANVRNHHFRSISKCTIPYLATFKVNQQPIVIFFDETNNNTFFNPVEMIIMQVEYQKKKIIKFDCFDFIDYSQQHISSMFENWQFLIEYEMNDIWIIVDNINKINDRYKLLSIIGYFQSLLDHYLVLRGINHSFLKIYIFHPLGHYCRNIDILNNFYQNCCKTFYNYSSTMKTIITDLNIVPIQEYLENIRKKVQIDIKQRKTGVQMFNVRKSKINQTVNIFKKKSELLGYIDVKKLYEVQYQLDRVNKIRYNIKNDKKFVNQFQYYKEEKAGFLQGFNLMDIQQVMDQMQKEEQELQQLQELQELQESESDVNEESQVYDQSSNYSVSQQINMTKSDRENHTTEQQQDDHKDSAGNLNANSTNMVDISKLINENDSQKINQSEGLKNLQVYYQLHSVFYQLHQSKIQYIENNNQIVQKESYRLIQAFNWIIGLIRLRKIQGFMGKISNFYNEELKVSSNDDILMIQQLFHSYINIYQPCQCFYKKIQGINHKRLLQLGLLEQLMKFINYQLQISNNLVQYDQQIISDDFYSCNLNIIFYLEYVDCLNQNPVVKYIYNQKNDYNFILKDNPPLNENVQIYNMFVADKEENEVSRSIFEYNFNLPDEDNFNIWGGDNNIQNYFYHQKSEQFMVNLNKIEKIKDQDEKNIIEQVKKWEEQKMDQSEYQQDETNEWTHHISCARGQAQINRYKNIASSDLSQFDNFKILLNYIYEQIQLSNDLKKMIYCVIYQKRFINTRKEKKKMMRRSTTAKIMDYEDNKDEDKQEDQLEQYQEDQDDKFTQKKLKKYEIHSEISALDYEVINQINAEYIFKEHSNELELVMNYKEVLRMIITEKIIKQMQIRPFIRIEKIDPKVRKYSIFQNYKKKIKQQKKFQYNDLMMLQQGNVQTKKRDENSYMRIMNRRIAHNQQKLLKQVYQTSLQIDPLDDQELEHNNMLKNLKKAYEEKLDDKQAEIYGYVRKKDRLKSMKTTNQFSQFSNLDRIILMKTILVHEFKIIIELEQSLLNQIEKYRRQDDDQKIHMQKIKKNQIPESWKKFIIDIENFESLSQFLVQYQKRKEYLEHFNLKLNQILESKQLGNQILIKINRLFDANQFLTNMLLQYSKINNIPILELQVRIEFVENEHLEEMLQNDSSSIFIKGLQITRGQINGQTLELEKQEHRQFITKLKVARLIIEQKKISQDNMFNQNINIYISKNYCGSLIEDYVKCQKKFLDHLIESQRQSSDYFNSSCETVHKHKVRVTSDEVYLVRVPMVMKTQQRGFENRNLSVQVYMKSKKPQVFWDKKGTVITINI